MLLQKQDKGAHEELSENARVYQFRLNSRVERYGSKP